METIRNLKKIISNGYLRYLLATEMYIVEPWEKVLIHTFVAGLFAVFWYMNYHMIVSEVPNSYMEPIL